jgi:hypothetical protein
LFASVLEEHVDENLDDIAVVYGVEEDDNVS